jgi:hypothetical protein
MGLFSDVGDRAIPVPNLTATAPSLPPISERSTLSIPVPVIDPKDPFLTLRQLETWHAQVTDRAYKNAHGTHSALATLMRDEGNRAMMSYGTPQMRHFHRIVTVNLLLTHVPTPSRDDILWSAFKHHFRQCLEVTAEKE